MISIAVEGKVSEPFGDLVSDWYIAHKLIHTYVTDNKVSLDDGRTIDLECYPGRGADEYIESTPSEWACDIGYNLGGHEFNWPSENFPTLLEAENGLTEEQVGVLRNQLDSGNPAAVLVWSRLRFFTSCIDENKRIHLIFDISKVDPLAAQLLIESYRALGRDLLADKVLKMLPTSS